MKFSYIMTALGQKPPKQVTGWYFLSATRDNEPYRWAAAKIDLKFYAAATSLYSKQIKRQAFKTSAIAQSYYNT